MKKLLILASILSFPLGILVGYFVFQNMDVSHHERESRSREIRESGYKYISPLLECEVEGTKLNALGPLKTEIEDLVSNEEASGKADDVAVYFRDLSNGPWFSVNSGDDFAPASLLKLPVLMAYYKKFEDHPDGLQVKLKYDKDYQLLFQSIEPAQTVQKGKEYTIEDLIERMIVYSDNAALAILEDNIEPGAIDKVTLDLGIETPSPNSPENYMSVRGYAGLFRILFNASYLEKDLSEKALEVLTRTQFEGGIVAGVPKGIKVAHKFGERQIDEKSTQLHDCGIVYYPGSPYLLCIMSRGTNVQDLARTISKISEKIYSRIDSYLSSSR